MLWNIHENTKVFSEAAGCIWLGIVLSASGILCGKHLFNNGHIRWWYYDDDNKKLLLLAAEAKETQTPTVPKNPLFPTHFPGRGSGAAGLEDHNPQSDPKWGQRTC